MKRDFFEGKVIVITGASSGIGLASARLFASFGARLSLAARSIDRLQAEAEKMSSASDILCVRTDVSVEADCRNLIERTVEKFGRIDILVNNAGVVFNKKIGMILRPETELMFRVNVIAVIEMVQLVSRLMARGKGGAIVNIASVTAVLGSPGQSAYSATKGAIMSFTKSAAKELAGLGIRVNAVAPGIVKTERFSELYEESGEKIDTRIQKIALGRLGTPEDVANACAFLASDRASYISGQILGVDGCASI